MAEQDSLDLLGGSRTNEPRRPARTAPLRNFANIPVDFARIAESPCVYWNRITGMEPRQKF